MPEPHLAIRAMTVTDIGTGMRFKDLAGWNQVDQDWRRFLELSPDGCFFAEIRGEPVGTVVTVILGHCCGWVAMVLVPPDRRRQGIGTALLNHGIAYLERKQVTTVKLDATPMGREVYVSLGFVDEYGLHRMEGVGLSARSENVRLLRPADLREIFLLDKPVCGVDRSPLLESLFRDAGETCGVYESDGRIGGYVMVRPGSRAYQIGPLVGTAPEVQDSLFAWALDRLAGHPVFFDVPLVNESAVAAAHAYGFAVQREFTRMYLGSEPFSGQPQQVFATSGPEKG